MTIGGSRRDTRGISWKKSQSRAIRYLLPVEFVFLRLDFLSIYSIFPFNKNMSCSGVEKLTMPFGMI